MERDNRNLAEGPGSVPKSDVRPSNVGDLGVDIASYQPASVAPTALHLHQVSENTPGHVGHEPEKHALPKVKTDFVPPGEHQPDPTYHSREPYPHAGESAAKPGAKSVQDQASKTDGNEGVLNQMAHKAAELYEGVKDKVAPALENVKEKASEAWHAVAGTIGAGPGSELKEDYTERLVAGQNETTRNNAQSSQQGTSAPQAQHGQDLGVDISSYQPPTVAPAGLYLHGAVKISETKDGRRPNEVVGEETAKP